MRHLSLLAVLTMLPMTVAAQEPARPPAAEVDPDALGISLDRIERKLEGKGQGQGQGQVSAGSPFGGNLKLDFFVGVVAEAPPIDFFANFNVHAGPVPGAAPSHREVIDHLTPEAFKSPAPDLLGLAAWLGERAYRRLQQERWERVYERYRERIEAGEDIPAPRPPGQQ